MTLRLRVARSAARLLALPILFAVPLAHPAGPDVPAFEEGVHQSLIDRMNEGQKREYDAALASFSAFTREHPDDVTAAVERCRFIAHFASLEEPVIESVYDQSNACTEALENSSFTDSALVQLYLLEQRYGDEAKKRGEALVRPSSRWTNQQQARLHERLADLYASTDVITAGKHALRAIRLDPQSGVRLIAAEYLIRIGAKTAAVRTIDAMPKEKWNQWELGSAVKLLVGMGAAKDANRLVDTNGKVPLDTGTRVLLARALFNSGASNAARRILQNTESGPSPQDSLQVPALRELFELERDFGSTKTASATYRRLRDTGYFADPFARHRLSLLLHHPGASWQLKDTQGIGALLLVLCGSALLPLVVVVPLHYRSLVRQVRGSPPQPPTPAAPWSLRHVWYALAVVCVTGMATLYFVDYPTFHMMVAVPFDIADQYEVLSSERQIGNAMLVSSTVSLIALLPLLRRTNLRALVLGDWTVKRSVFTAIGMCFAILVVNGIFNLTVRRHLGAAALGTETTRGLQGIQAAYGAGAMLVYVAGVIPILEEFVFRGVLLRATSRYIAFWIAVLVQAGAFVIFHEDTSGYPFIFALALVAAWLARRSGGLLAPITLHAINNLLVGLSLIAAGNALEYIK